MVSGCIVLRKRKKRLTLIIFSGKDLFLDISRGSWWLNFLFLGLSWLSFFFNLHNGFNWFRYGFRDNLSNWLGFDNDDGFFYDRLFLFGFGFGLLFYDGFFLFGFLEFRVIQLDF